MTLDRDARALMGLLVEGRYRLEAILGSGGTGLVFRAADESGGAPIAIKVLHSHHAPDSDTAKRFLREATLEGLRHPNIVEVQTAGMLSDDRPYLAMELLEGEGLDVRLGADDQLPVVDSVRIALDVLDGLDAAHAAGFVHRDVKPANVFLAHTAETVTAKLLDFSVARVSSSHGVSVTATGDVVGTPLYLAPEQATGVKGLDGRVDVWACGVLLYRMLTGRAPFSDKQLASLILKIVSEVPPAPRSLRPEVPEAVEAVVLRALEKAREARFASAAEMADALRRVELA